MACHFPVLYDDSTWRCASYETACIIDPPEKERVDMTVPQQNPTGKPQSMTVCGIIGVVFAALAVVLSFIPIINNLAAILGVIGAVLALIGLVGAARGKKKGKAVSVIGVVLSVLAIIITLAMQSAASKAIDDSAKATKGIEASQPQTSAKTQSADSKAQGAQDTEGDIDGAHVKIMSAVKSGRDYENKPTVVVTYEWTNTTTRNNSFATLAHPQVFQNGVELATAIYTDSPSGYDADSYMRELQPGTSSTVTIGYVLTDDSPVDVEVSAFLAVNSGVKVTHEFNMQ